MVRPASIHTGHCSCEMYVTSVPGSNNNVVQVIQVMLGSGVHPGCFEFMFLPEEGVGDRKIVFCTLGQEEYTIGVDIPYPLFSNDALHVV